jgi:hypothetical protein
VLQVTPHAPQLLTSVASFTQAPLHLLKPVAQTKSQLPLLQTAVPLAGAEQAWPQAPQLFRSVARLTSQPVPALRSQSP